MTDDKKTDDVIDIEALTDEEFLKLDVPPAEIVDPDAKENGDAKTADGLAADAALAAAGGGDDTTKSTDGDGENGSSGGGTGDTAGGEDGSGSEGAGKTELTDEQKAAEKLAAEEAAAAVEAEKTKKVNDDKETLKLKDADGKEITETAEQKTAREAEEAAAEALEQQGVSDDFFKKVSAPFKADGKEVQVRTPEEAVRLMQMGVNYNKRMKEMKPLRAMNAMLEAHGLNDVAKLNELIDLSKGGKEAIQAFLKKNNIDPLDLDMEKADAHATPNYQTDPKDVEFQDAIETTLSAEGGKELIADINADWDPASKESLRENPSIFGKLLDQRDTGVYSQIQKELLHQKNMGYLANVPYLKAYEQVGNAMQKAGVFDTTTEKTGLAPIHSGSRKSTAKPKTAETNPNLSSTSTTAKPAAKAAPKEPDYLSMSDADFMNLAPPG